MAPMMPWPSARPMLASLSTQVLMPNPPQKPGAGMLIVIWLSDVVRSNCVSIWEKC